MYNWAAETEQYEIKFEYIKGINTLVDTINRLIVIIHDTFQDPEPEDQECGYCIVEELPNVSMLKKVSPKVSMTLNEIMVSSVDPSAYLHFGITCKGMCQLQQEDPFVKG